MANQEASARAILYALCANFGIAIAKTWAAIYTGSGSMLAEAIHSYADTGNQVLLFLGLVQSRKPGDAEHPLGYGKLSYFWAFIVAIMLFSLGGLFSIYEGFHKLQEPEPIRQAWVGLVVLAFGIVLEGGSTYGAAREIAKLKGDKTYWRWVRTTRNAELVVILGEDIGACLGLLLAFCFLGWSAVTGDPTYDALGSIAIGVVLVIMSVMVGIKVKALIVGKSAEPELRAMIDHIIEEDPVIERLLNSVTLQMGPKVMLAAKIKMQPGLSVNEAVSHINAMERSLKAQVPELGWCFIEPDVRD